MAKVQLNPIVNNVRGKLGRVVFRRYGTETIMASLPNTEGREWTEAQLAARERFRQAATYTKAALANPLTRAVYEEAAQSRRLPITSVAMADWLNGPTIQGIDLDGYDGDAGDTILVEARDDLRVMGVTVSLTEVGGAPIESGPALEEAPGSGHWVFTTTMPVTTGSTVQVTAIATDRPGGTAHAEAEKVVQ